MLVVDRIQDIVLGRKCLGLAGFPHTIEKLADSLRLAGSLLTSPPNQTMNPTRAAILSLLMSVAALPCAAQTPAIPSQPAARATIAGIVVKDPGSEPVKKAVIELIAENQQGGENYTSVTNVDGSFRIEGIVPGRYHLFAERTGYLEAGKNGSRSHGRILTLAGGQELKDIQIHLAAAAVVTGRVTDEDGDPLQNAEVSVLRRSFSSGHAHWQQVGSERTNDLGEYRIAGLAAGSYYVSVNPPPDFKSLLDAGSSAASERQNAGDRPEKALTSYQTTYYPGTPDRSQAEMIQLHAGDDFPLDFSLAPSPTLTIRGSVMNVPPRASATIMLESNDFNTVFNDAEIHKDGSFVIRDVSPGAYTIIATIDDAAVPMMARQPLQVVSNNVEGLRLTPQTGATVRGRLRFEGATNGTGRVDPQQMFLALRSADGEDDALTAFSIGNGFSPLARIASDGTFQWTNVPPGNYYIRLGREQNGNADYFLKSIITGGRASEDSAISVNGGLAVLDLVADTNGGMVEGVVTDSKGEPVADAVIVAAPELRLRSRIDRFHKTVSDQYGRFSLRGIAPGQYSLFAWDNVDGDAYYDPDFLKNYEEQASSLRVSEGDHTSVQLQAIPTTDDSH